MWYPNIKLTRRIRIGIMLTLIASFFVASPLILLYTAGYRYDLKNFAIRKTGVITIDAEPTNARVYFNEVLLNKSLPIRLPNIAPGSYDLRIEKEGYLPWKKTIQVESTKTTYITDLFLFLDTLPTLELIPIEGHLESSYSPDGAFIASVVEVDQEANFYEIYLNSVESEEDAILWRGETLIRPQLVWSRHAPLIAFAVKNTPETIQIKTINTKNLGSQQETYTLEATSTPRMQWHEEGSDILYTAYQDTIVRLSQGNMKPLSPVTSSVWFVDSAEDIWSITSDDAIWKNDVMIHQHVDTTGIIELVDSRASHLLARDHNATYVVWLDSGETTRIPANHLFPRTYGKNWSTWILWSEWEVLELLESGEVNLLTRTNSPLRDVSASTKHDTLFFAFDTHISSFHPHYRTSHTLYTGNSSIKNIATQEKGDYIIFETAINEKQGVYQRAL